MQQYVLVFFVFSGTEFSVKVYWIVSRRYHHFQSYSGNSSPACRFLRTFFSHADGFLRQTKSFLLRKLYLTFPAHKSPSWTPYLMVDQPWCTHAQYINIMYVLDSTRQKCDVRIGVAFLSDNATSPVERAAEVWQPGLRLQSIVHVYFQYNITIITTTTNGYWYLL